jgi:hypothetical protein
MNITKRLAAQVAGAAAIATLMGTSAFAETRHLDTTNDDRAQQVSDQRGDHRRNHSSDRQSNTQNDRRGSSNSQSDRNGDRGRTQSDVYRNGDRSRTQSDAYRNTDRSRVQADTYRNNDRSRTQSDAYRNGGYNGGYQRQQSYGYQNNRSSYDSRGRQSMSVEGRINRFVHESGGYRIWVDGGRFPVWIPEARISLFPHLRVGLSLRIGGYYDPLGYVEAYDYYNGGYNGGYGNGYGSAYGGGSSSGVLRGVVETVDYRRGTLVLRDDVSGNFVTAVIRDRQLETLRPGDYAEISGDWTRGGLFEGLRLEDSGGGRY